MKKFFAIAMLASCFAVNCYPESIAKVGYRIVVPTDVQNQLVSFFQNLPENFNSMDQGSKVAFLKQNLNPEHFDVLTQLNTTVPTNLDSLQRVLSQEGRVVQEKAILVPQSQEIEQPVTTQVSVKEEGLAAEVVPEQVVSTALPPAIINVTINAVFTIFFIVFVLTVKWLYTSYLFFSLLLPLPFEYLYKT